MSTGNSLGHVPNEDIKVVLDEMDKLVDDGGYLYFDSRNWDKIRREKKRFYTYPPIFINDERINFVQVWDHEDTTITFNFLYNYEKENKIIGQEILHETYFPFERVLIENKLETLGYDITKSGAFSNAGGDIQTTDWYFILAKKRSY
jgi:hypothetical protein